jgi:hypothetical protein
MDCMRFIHFCEPTVSKWSNLDECISLFSVSQARTVFQCILSRRNKRPAFQGPCWNSKIFRCPAIANHSIADYRLLGKRSKDWQETETISTKCWIQKNNFSIRKWPILRNNARKPQNFRNFLSETRERFAVVQHRSGDSVKVCQLVGHGYSFVGAVWEPVSEITLSGQWMIDLQKHRFD